MRPTKLLLLVLVSLLVLAGRGFAQTEKTRKSLGGNVSLPLRKDYNPNGPIVTSAGYQLITYDQWYTYMLANPSTWTNTFTINSSSTNVVLRYEDEKRVNNKGDWTLKIYYTLTTYNTSGSPTTFTTTTSYTNTTANQVLEINYRDGFSSGTDYKDLDINRYPGYVASRIKINEIRFYPNDATGTTPSYTNAIPDELKEDIYLDLEQETDRHYVLNTAAIPTVTPTHDYTTTIVTGTSTSADVDGDADPTTTPLNNEVSLSWQHISGAESYDLEWVFVDIGTGAFPPTANYDFDFSNATRVNLSANTYKIPLTFPRGILIYRIRTVTHDPSTPDLRIQGDWSLANTTGTGSTSSLSSCNCKIEYDGLEYKKNWQSVTVFAEDGKRKEVISFYDGTMRNRQAVTVSNTEQNAIVAENFYDYEGRQALNVLPAPLASTGIHYYNNFNKNGAGDPYKKENFDHHSGSGFPEPESFLTTSGAAKYYSPNNTMTSVNSDYIPDANGYIYSRTFFTQDGTNRPKSVSGVGEVFKPAASNDKTTKYFYGKPTSQDELDAMFGNEVGHLAHYFKSSTIDPNGQVSYVYTDMNGRTIATCISGTVPTNLIEVDNKPDPVDVEEDLLENNNLLTNNNTSLVSTTSIMTGETTTYDFTYHLGESSYDIDCAPDVEPEYTADCKYDLLIYVQDNEGDLLNPTTFTYTVTSGTPTTYTSNPVVVSNISTTNVAFSITFQPGNYKVTKVLRVVPYGSTNAYTLPDPSDLIECVAVPLVTMAGCGNSCETSCTERYKRTAPDGSVLYINDLNEPISAESAAVFIATCQQECIDHNSQLVNNPSGLSKCDFKLLQIKNDMSPGGQYFDNLQDPANINDWLNDLSLSTPHPNIDEGTFFSDLTTLLGVTIHNWGDVRTYWDPQVLDADLTSDAGTFPFYQYHPEYKAYEFYCTGIPACSDESGGIIPNSLDYDENNLLVTANTFSTTPISTHTLFNPLNTTPTTYTVLPIPDPAAYCPYTFTTTTQDPIIGWANGGTCPTLCGDCSPEKCNDLDAVIKYNLENYFTFTGTDSNPHTFSIWYVMDNPDDIANPTTPDPLGYLPTYVIDLFDQLHAGGTVNGPIDINDPLSKYTWFHSQYKLFKDYILYKFFNALNPGYNYVSLPGTITSVPDPPYFIPRFPENPMYATVFSLGCDLKINVPDNLTDAQTAAGGIQTDIAAQCSTDCAASADSWMAKLADCGIVNGGSTATLYSDIRTNLINVCIANCDAGTVSSGTVTGTPVIYGSSGCPMGTTTGCPPSTGVPYHYTAGGASEDFYTFEDVIGYFTTSTSYTPCVDVPVYHPALNTQDPSLSADEQAGLCDCNKLIYYTTNSTDFSQPFNPYDPSNHAAIATAINSHDVSYTFTYSDVDTWMTECAKYKPIESNLTGLPDFLKCSQEPGYDRADCSCERFKGFFNTLGIQWEGTTFSSDEKDNLVDLINGFIKPPTPVTLTDLQTWLTECSDPTPDMTTMLGASTIPALFACPLLPVDPTATDVANTLSLSNCQTQTLLSSTATAAITYYTNIAALNNQIANEYNETCLNNILNSVTSMSPLETFTVEYERNTFLYTLYYYDQAGNLIKTVPPQGVHLLSTSTALNNVANHRAGSDPIIYYPPHDFITTYRYDFQDKLTYQNTPDAGTSTFAYNRKHQLLFSQNARQITNGDFSYSIYDDLGRVTEVGEADLSGTGITIDNDLTCEMTSTAHADLITVTGAIPANNSQVTKTIYDEKADAFDYNSVSVDLHNLRNRVAQTELDMDGDGSYESATHYSYDIHGNVNELYQENLDAPLVMLGQTVKKVTYGYDLISGKVNEVHYQPGYQDQFHYQYEYDADNRITRVLTSNDGYLYRKDAKYFYYPHGPLARTEVGDKQVQGQDYAYTLQGWIKGVNSNTLKNNRDMGRDALTKYGIGNIGDNSALSLGSNASFRNRSFGSDAFGYSLHYYNDDYKAVTVPAYTAPTEADVADFFLIATATDTEADNVRNHPGLYNGNISRMVVSFLDNTEIIQDIHNNLYRYDQLNRIKSREIYIGASTEGTNLWDEGTLATSKWQEHFSYDFNGNISYADRNGNQPSFNVSMDDLTYYYFDNTGAEFIAGTTPAGGAKPTNKLSRVNDNVTDANRYTTDIDDQGTNNYAYDNIGNLTRDNNEDIVLIDWNVYGKIRGITRDGSSTKDDLEFLYDPSGNRIAKIVMPRSGSGLKRQEFWKYTYYVRDAQGNILSNYELTFEAAGSGGGNSSYIHKLEQTDVPVYGSSRLGVYNADQLLTANTPTATATPTLTVSGINPATFTYVSSPIDQQEPLAATDDYERTLGNKQYEFGNHLGNVMSTASDRKLIQTSNVFKATEEFEYTPASNIFGGNNGTRGDIVYNTLSSGYSNSAYSAGFIDKEIGSGDVISASVDSRRQNTSTVNPSALVIQVFDAAGHSAFGADLPLATTNTWTPSSVLSYTFNPALYSFTSGPYKVRVFVWSPGYTFSPVNTPKTFVDNLTVEINHVGSLREFDYFSADVLSSTDYYAFGAPQPGRNFNSSDYRYGYQKQEQDQELWDGAVSFKYRIEDPRLGRFFSVDPLTYKYPYNSPYAFSENRIMDGIELEGLEVAIFHPEYNPSKGWTAEDEKTLGTLLSFTDVNDVAVLTTTVTRAGNGINTDGTKATTTDKWFAAGGVLLPVVSGSLVKKGLKLGFEGFQQSFRILNWTEKTFSAFKGAAKGALRNSLIKAGLDLTGKEAHHLIPKELLLDNKVVQDAVEDGFDFNGVINGMVVNKGHGPHKNYTDQIIGKIDEWKQANPDYKPGDAKEFLTNLAGEAREAVGKTIKEGKNVDDAVLK
jgi:hypothetical protein